MNHSIHNHFHNSYRPIIIMHVLSHQPELVRTASSGNVRVRVRVRKRHSRFAAVLLPCRFRTGSGGNWPSVLRTSHGSSLFWRWGGDSNPCPLHGLSLICTRLESYNLPFNSHDIDFRRFHKTESVGLEPWSPPSVYFTNPQGPDLRKVFIQ